MGRREQYAFTVLSLSPWGGVFLPSLSLCSVVPVVFSLVSQPLSPFIPPSSQAPPLLSSPPQSLSPAALRGSIGVRLLAPLAPPALLGLSEPTPPSCGGSPGRAGCLAHPCPEPGRQTRPAPAVAGVMVPSGKAWGVRGCCSVVPGWPDSLCSPRGASGSATLVPCLLCLLDMPGSVPGPWHRPARLELLAVGTLGWLMGWPGAELATS